jgi:hypothetical protein
MSSRRSHEDDAKACLLCEQHAVDLWTGRMGGHPYQLFEGHETGEIREADLGLGDDICRLSDDLVEGKYDFVFDRVRSGLRPEIVIASR